MPNRYSWVGACGIHEGKDLPWGSLRRTIFWGDQIDHPKIRRFAKNRFFSRQNFVFGKNRLFREKKHFAKKGKRKDFCPKKSTFFDFDFFEFFLDLFRIFTIVLRPFASGSNSLTPKFFSPRTSSREILSFADPCRPHPPLSIGVE